MQNYVFRFLLLASNAQYQPPTFDRANHLTKLCIYLMLLYLLNVDSCECALLCFWINPRPSLMLVEFDI